MKKLIIALFVLGIALPTFAGIKVKDVVGTWSFKIELDYEEQTGTLVFKKEGKELTSEVVTSDGQIIPMTKVEIRENNVLYFETNVENSIMEISMTIEGKKYTGTIVADVGEIAVTGEKIE